MSTASTPVYANVAFLRIPQFSTLPVGEQAALKEKLENRARLALESIPADVRHYGGQRHPAAPPADQVQDASALPGATRS